MPDCFNTLDSAFAAVASGKKSRRLWTILTFQGSTTFYLFWSASNAGQVVAGMLNKMAPPTAESTPRVLPDKDLPQLKKGGVDKTSDTYMQNQVNMQTVKATKTLRADVADMLAAQLGVNTLTFTGHAEERMLLNFGALYTCFATASGQIPTVIIYNSDSPCTVDDPRASNFLQPRSCTAKLNDLAQRYPLTQFTVYYYKAYHGGGAASTGSAASSSSVGVSNKPHVVSGSNITLLPFTPELLKLCANYEIR